jgi:CDP-diacylglycerol--serine O-phosphatidyltransferase
LIKQHLPNALTLANLFCGSLAVLNLVYGRLEWVTGLVMLAALADLLDGMVARALGVTSPMGKELDSLADMVSFGLVPGVIAYGLLIAMGKGGIWPNQLQLSGLPGLAITLASALRLGKFNLDERQHQDFIGLPTPASTLFMLGLLAIYQQQGKMLTAFPAVLPLLYLLLAGLCWLMLAEIPMFSLKFKSRGWKGNEIKIIFAALSLVLLFVFQAIAFVWIILIYLSLSLFLNFRKRNRIL